MLKHLNHFISFLHARRRLCWFLLLVFYVAIAVLGNDGVLQYDEVIYARLAEKLAAGESYFHDSGAVNLWRKEQPVNSWFADGWGRG